MKAYQAHSHISTPNILQSPATGGGKVEDMQKATFQALFKDARRHTRSRGNVLIHANEISSGVFFLRKGYVKKYDITSEGTLQLITIIGPNEIFPDYWSFDENTSDLYYEAMCDVEFSIITLEAFKEEIVSDTELLKQILALAIKLLHSSQQRIQNLQLPSVRQRIAYRLLHFAEYYGKEEKNRLVIPVPLTYDDLADTLNTGRDTVNREVLRLVREGLVSRDRKYFVINDIQSLQTVADGKKLQTD